MDLYWIMGGYYSFLSKGEVSFRSNTLNSLFNRRCVGILPLGMYTRACVIWCRTAWGQAVKRT